MNNMIQIQCPDELLLSLHMNSEELSELVKWQTALALFRDGKLSSGLAAKWLGVGRVYFLLKALHEGGASLLEDSLDDFNRETSLL